MSGSFPVQSSSVQMKRDARCEDAFTSQTGTELWQWLKYTVICASWTKSKKSNNKTKRRIDRRTDGRRRLYYPRTLANAVGDKLYTFAFRQTSNEILKIGNLSNHIDLHIHAGNALGNLDLWPFNLIYLAQLLTVMDCICIPSLVL